MANEVVLKLRVTSDGLEVFDMAGRKLDMLNDKAERASGKGAGGGGLGGLFQSFKDIEAGIKVFTRATQGAVQFAEKMNELGTNSIRARSALDILSGGKADEYLSRASKATRGLVDDMTLAQNASKALGLKIVNNSQEFADLARIGNTLGLTFRNSATEGVETLTVALTRVGLTGLLDNIGISGERVKTKFEALKSTLGESGAWKAAILEEGLATTNKLEGSMDHTGEAVGRLGTKFDNLKAQASEAFAGLLDSAITTAEQMTQIAGWFFSGGPKRIVREDMTRPFSLDEAMSRVAPGLPMGFPQGGPARAGIGLRAGINYIPVGSLQTYGGVPAGAYAGSALDFMRSGIPRVGDTGDVLASRAQWAMTGRLQQEYAYTNARPMMDQATQAQAQAVMLQVAQSARILQESSYVYKDLVAAARADVTGAAQAARIRQEAGYDYGAQMKERQEESFGYQRRFAAGLPAALERRQTAFEKELRAQRFGTGPTRAQQASLAQLGQERAAYQMYYVEGHRASPDEIKKQQEYFQQRQRVIGYGGVSRLSEQQIQNQLTLRAQIDASGLEKFNLAIGATDIKTVAAEHAFKGLQDQIAKGQLTWEAGAKKAALFADALAKGDVNAGNLGKALYDLGINDPLARQYQESVGVGIGENEFGPKSGRGLNKGPQIPTAKPKGAPLEITTQMKEAQIQISKAQSNMLDFKKAIVDTAQNAPPTGVALAAAGVVAAGGLLLATNQAKELRAQLEAMREISINVPVTIGGTGGAGGTNPPAGGVNPIGVTANRLLTPTGKVTTKGMSLEKP